jgi:hypothetical protein
MVQTSIPFVSNPDELPPSSLFDPDTVTVTGERKRVLYWSRYENGFRGYSQAPARMNAILWLVMAGMIEQFDRRPPRRYQDAEIAYRITDFGRIVLDRSRNEGFDFGGSGEIHS